MEPHKDINKKISDPDIKALSPLGDKRYIIAGTHNAMGMGDVTHLVTILGPTFLQTFSDRVRIAPPKENKDDKSAFEIIYAPIVIDKVNVLLNVITLFQTQGILTTLPDWKGKPITSDNISAILRDKEDVLAYLQQITKENPHVHIIPMQFDTPEGKSEAFANYLSKTEGGELLQAQANHACFFPSISAPGGQFVTPLLQTSFGEHGGLRGEKKDSIISHYMGFSRSEYGVFMEHPERLMLAPKPDRDFSGEDEKILQRKVLELKDLSDKSYLTSLMGEEKDESNFLRNNLFIPGYFQNKFATAVSICGLAITPEAKKYSGVVFHMNGFDEKLLNKRLLAEHGIAKIEIQNAPPKDKKVIDLKQEGFEVTGEERTLKIMNGYRLNDKDYAKLYKIAQCFAGSSGDTSLQMILSNGLIPIYQVRRWKEDFVKDFSKMAEAIKYPESDSFNLDDPDPASLIRFGKQLEIDDEKLNEEAKTIPKVSETLASCFTPHSIQCWKLLIDTIQKEYNFAAKVPEFLCQGIAYSHLYQYIINGENKKAEEILEKFFNNKSDPVKLHQDDLFGICNRALYTNQPRIAAFVCHYAAKSRGIDLLSQLKSHDFFAKHQGALDEYYREYKESPRADDVSARALSEQSILARKRTRSDDKAAPDDAPASPKVKKPSSSSPPP